MKVLHIINGEFYSGTERVQDLLVQNMPYYGVDALLVCIKPGTFGSRCFCDPDLVFEIPMKSRIDFGKVRPIVQLVREHKIDLLHSHTPRSVIVSFLVAKIVGIPFVHHVHSPTKADSTRVLRNRVNALLENNLLNYAAQIMPVSDSLATEFCKSKSLRDKVSIVPNGVVSARTLPRREAPREPWILGSMALYRPRKGLEVLLRALAGLKANGRNVRLRAVGEFETTKYEQTVKNLARELDVYQLVDWIGFVSNVESEFQKMDVFVLPSLFGEGMPMVVLEAMANGVPIVSTNVEGIPEVLNTEAIGVVVEPDDHHALMEGVIKMLDGTLPWDSIRDAAYQRQIDLYSDVAMAEKTVNIYRKVLLCQPT